MRFNSEEYAQASDYLDHLMSLNKNIEIKPIRKRQSLPQNAYLHVVIALWGIDRGYTPEESKVVLKREYGLYYEKNGKKFIRSSSSLDTKESTEFIEWIRNNAAMYGNYIPSAEEYLIKQYEIDREINKTKDFSGRPY